MRRQDERGLGHRGKWRRRETAQETPVTRAFYERRGGASVQKEIDAAKHVVRLSPSSMLFLQQLYLALVGCWELPLQQRGMKGLTLCSREAHKKKSSAALGFTRRWRRLLGRKC